MQDDQDNGEFPVSDNPESNQTSYDDEADRPRLPVRSKSPTTALRPVPVPRAPGRAPAHAASSAGANAAAASSMDDDHFTLPRLFPVVRRSRAYRAADSHFRPSAFTRFLRAR